MRFLSICILANLLIPSTSVASRADGTLLACTFDDGTEVSVHRNDNRLIWLENGTERPAIFKELQLNSYFVTSFMMGGITHNLSLSLPNDPQNGSPAKALLARTTETNKVETIAGIHDGTCLVDF